MMVIGFFIFLLGLTIGSFLNVCIYRLPRRESIIHGVSHCPHCQEKLPWRLKLPVVSYVFLNGSCHFCQRPISWHYPFVELLTAACFLMIFQEYGLTEMALRATIICSILIAASFTDIQNKIIPNSLILFGIIVALYFIALEEFKSITDYFFGGLLGSGILFLVALLGTLLCRRAGMGGGDIKLALVIGLFIGTKGMITTLAIAIMTGAIFSIAGMLTRKLQLTSRITFAPFLAWGTFVYIFSKQLVLRYSHPFI